MMQVSVEVRSGAARFRVSVRASSIERAVSLAVARYPGGEAGLVLTIDPESFFVKDPAGEGLEHRVPEALAV